MPGRFEASREVSSCQTVEVSGQLLKPKNSADTVEQAAGRCEDQVDLQATSFEVEFCDLFEDIRSQLDQLFELFVNTTKAAISI